MNTLVRVVALIVLTVSVCDAYRIMLWDFDGATDTFEDEPYPALWLTYDDHTWEAGSDRARAEVPGNDPLRPPVFWDAASVDFKMGSETSDLHVSDQISELRDALDGWDAVTDDLSVNAWRRRTAPTTPRLLKWTSS